MTDRSTTRRNSDPEPAPIIQDEQQRAFVEAQNGLLQFDEVLRLIDDAVRTASTLRPSTIMSLNRIAIQGLYASAGNFRTVRVFIQGSKHDPPQWEDVPRHVEEMCEYVNSNWATSTALHLSAFVMWRLNWIHPFEEGNGRTARAVSYFVLCARLGYRLPGSLTIAEQIVANREPYYAALDEADARYAQGLADVTAMEQVLSQMLARQLVKLHEQASTGMQQQQGNLH